MNYRILGKSGLEISEICFGVMSFTGPGGWVLENEEMQILDQVSAPPKPYPQWYFNMFCKERRRD